MFEFYGIFIIKFLCCFWAGPVYITPHPPSLCIYEHNQCFGFKNYFFSTLNKTMKLFKSLRECKFINQNM